MCIIPVLKDNTVYNIPTLCIYIYNRCIIIIDIHTVGSVDCSAP